MYSITLKHGSWNKRLYFQSTTPSGGFCRYRALLQEVELIGAISTSMREFSDRVSALFHDAGFVRIQK